MPGSKFNHSKKSIREEAFRINLQRDTSITRNLPARTSATHSSSIKRFWLGASEHTKPKHLVSPYSLDSTAHPVFRSHSTGLGRENPVRIGESYIGGNRVSWIGGSAVVSSVAHIAAMNSTLKKLDIRFVKVKCAKTPHSKTGEHDHASQTHAPQTVPMQTMLDLRLLWTTAKRFGLYVISELRQPKDLDETLSYCDIIEIGETLHQDASLLRHLGSLNTVVLLTRHSSFNLDQYLSAVRYIEDGGKARTILAVSGTRTCTDSTGSSTFLDISSILSLRQACPCPIVVDFGTTSKIVDLKKTSSADIEQIAKSALVAGASGFLAQLHLNYVERSEKPPHAFSPKQLGSFMKRMEALKLTLTAMAHHQCEEAEK